MEASLSSLTSELHEAIASHLELEDLLMMGSTCQHFRKLVSASESEVTWTQLYDTYWGTTAHPHGISARAAFKMRWQAEHHRLRYKRQLRIMKLQSQLETKRKERSDAQHALKRARVSIQQLDKERAGLVQARTLGHVEQVWQPAVVKNHHQQLLASTPIMSEARLREVEMALKDNSLAMRSSMKRVDASKSKVESLESELSSLYSRYLGRPYVEERGGSGQT